jgi:hypothetical protein
MRTKLIKGNPIKCGDRTIRDYHPIRLIPIHLYLVDKGLSEEQIGALTLDGLEEMLNNEILN